MKMRIRAFLLGLCCIFVGIAIAETMPVLETIKTDQCITQKPQEVRAVQNNFIEPDDSRNYANYRYVGAHNAHVYPPFYEIIIQQDADTVSQLALGVRGLMLDTYDWTLNWPYERMGDGSVVLSHGQPGDLIVTAQKVNLTYQTLKWELSKIVNWMMLNPLAVVTIVLEDYANPSTTATEIKQVMQEVGYDPLLKRVDWPIAPNVAYTWPTLGWMRQNNKRLIIFTQRAGSTDVTWNQFNYCAENQYSTTNKDDLWQERAESAAKAYLPRQLLVFNDFPADPFTSLPIFSQEQMKYSTVKDVITYCQTKGLDKGRIFNGYYVDRVIAATNILIAEGQATAFDYVNELNLRADPTTP